MTADVALISVTAKVSAYFASQPVPPGHPAGLILLCSMHHAFIDKKEQEVAYPAPLLRSSNAFTNSKSERRPRQHAPRRRLIVGNLLGVWPSKPAEMLVVATPIAPAAELASAVVRAAAGGDDVACRALVDLYQDRVFALASRMLVGRGRATVEDVAQDTFLHVFRRLAAFDVAGPARLSTWIR